MKKGLKMKLIDLKNIDFPTKKDEDFRKIDISKLLENEYNKVKEYKLDFNTIDKSFQTENELVKINKQLESKTYELKIIKSQEEPIVIVHTLKEDNTLYTNDLHITVEKGIEVSIVEFFVSSCKNSFYSINRDFHIKDNGVLNYIKYQDINETNNMICNTIIDLEEEATINSSAFEMGDGINLNIYDTNLDKKGSSLNLYGLVSLKDKANSSTIFNTTHNEQETYSDIKYKHSLRDSSKAVYEAKSKVNEKGIKTKVFQSSDTILLSDEATIFAKPHLEISIDELEASHAATTGSLDKNQLHYLQTRGIPKNEAFEILLKAFENEIFDTITNQKAKELVKDFKRGDYV